MFLLLNKAMVQIKNLGEGCSPRLNVWGVKLFYNNFANLVTLAADIEAVFGVGYADALQVEVLDRSILGSLNLGNTGADFLSLYYNVVDFPCAGALGGRNVAEADFNFLTGKLSKVDFGTVVEVPVKCRRSIYIANLCPFGLAIELSNNRNIRSDSLVSAIDKCTVDFELVECLTVVERQTGEAATASEAFAAPPL